MSTHYPQNKVSGAIWHWQKSAPGQKQVQPGLLFSLLTMLVAWGVGGLLYFYDHTTIAIVAFSISTFVFIAAQFFPKVYGVVESVFQKFSALVGGFLTWIFLVPFFYICFPFGKIAQILKKKDPMHRKLEPEVESYWKNCKERESVDDYKRQF